MLLIAILVFLGVFGVIALLLVASGSGASEQGRVLMTRLESAIAVGKPEMADLIVDVRKNELMSSIPWLDRWLAKIELAPPSPAPAVSGQCQVDGRRADPYLQRLFRHSRLSGLLPNRRNHSLGSSWDLSPGARHLSTCSGCAWRA